VPAAEILRGWRECSLRASELAANLEMPRELATNRWRD
jgi:hypothetical protein